MSGPCLAWRRVPFPGWLIVLGPLCLVALGCGREAPKVASKETPKVAPEVASKEAPKAESEAEPKEEPKAARPAAEAPPAVGAAERTSVSQPPPTAAPPKDRKAHAAPAGAQPAKPKAAPTKDIKPLDIKSKLKQPVTFDFTDSTLGDVVDFLRDFTGVNIVLDTPALKAAGVTGDTTVNMKLKDVTLKAALRLMLDQIGVTYVVRDESIVITSRAKSGGR